MNLFFFFQAEDGIRDDLVTGVQTCALPISRANPAPPPRATRLTPAAAPSWSSCATAPSRWTRPSASSTICAKLRLPRLKAGGSDPLPLSCFRLRGANASQFGAEAPGPSQVAHPPAEPG